MPDDAELGAREVHQTAIGGERVLIRRARPEDVALYRDFLAGVSTEDLRLRFFANVGELSAEEMDKLRHLDYRHEMAFIATLGSGNCISPGKSPHAGFDGRSGRGGRCRSPARGAIGIVDLAATRPGATVRSSCLHARVWVGRIRAPVIG